MAAQVGELLEIKDIRGGVEAQGHGGGLSVLRHAAGQAVEGGGADAAADEDGVPGAFVGIKAVAQAREQVKHGARLGLAQLRRALAGHPDQQRQRLLIPVAHGDGSAQKGAAPDSQTDRDG